MFGIYYIATHFSFIVIYTSRIAIFVFNSSSQPGYTLFFQCIALCAFYCLLSIIIQKTDDAKHNVAASVTAAKYTLGKMEMSLPFVVVDVYVQASGYLQVRGNFQER